MFDASPLQIICAEAEPVGIALTVTDTVPGFPTQVGNQINISDAPTALSGTVATTHIVNSPSFSADSAAVNAGIFIEINTPATSYNCGSQLGSYMISNHFGTGTANGLYGYYANIANKSSGTIANSYGGYFLNSNTSSGNITTSCYGTFNQAQNTGAGTVGDAAGVYARVVMNNASGTITTAYGFAIGKVGTGAITNTAGTITTAYGLYIDTVQGTTKWSIYQADSTAPNYLSARTLIGSSTDNASGAIVQVTGSQTITNNLSVGGHINNPYSINFTSGDNNGVSFWATSDPSTYGIQMCSASNATYGGRIAGETTSDFNMYFSMSNGTNRGWVFRNITTNVFAINGDAVRSNVNMNIIGTLTATSKSFLIDHPTKPNMKLQYGSLEGNENAVYNRGRLTNSNVIELPDYWTGLVDENTITVQLTSIGEFQNLYVVDIKDNKIIVGGENINCFYFVQAERKDIEKLVVEF